MIFLEVLIHLLDNELNNSSNLANHKESPINEFLLHIWILHVLIILAPNFLTIQLFVAELKPVINFCHFCHMAEMCRILQNSPQNDFKYILF